MTAPVVLGIDPSLHLGWAVMSPGWQKPVFGLIEMISPDDYGYGRALNDLRFKIGVLIEDHGVTHGFIEKPILIINPSRKHQVAINLSSRLTLHKIEGAVEQEFHARGLPDLAWVENRDWHQRFIGKTTAPPGYNTIQARRDWWKSQSKKACARRDWYTADDNEADALGITDYGLSTISPSYRTRTDPLSRRGEIAFSGDE